MLRQRWDALTFVHWRYPPAVVQRLLPPRLTVEEIDGSAWVGLLPFVARRTSLAGLRLPPALGDFPETNVRTYVRTGGGRSALWFFSLEVANLPLAVAARAALGLPYRWADMEAATGADRCRYASRRRTGGVGHTIDVRPGAALDPGRLPERDHLLTGRWRAVVPRGGGLITVRVEHPPWPLHEAELLSCDEGLLADAGLPAPDAAPHVLWSPGVGARLGKPRAR